MRKILLFPYHPDIDLLLEHASSLKEVQIIGISSYKEDLVVTDPLNRKLGNTGNFHELLAECDSLLLLENYRNCTVDKYYEVMKEALSAGKQVVLVPQLLKELDLGPFQGTYQVLENLPNTDTYIQDSNRFQEERKYKIQTPIIAVFGMGKHCNKFENQILLQSILEEEGFDGIWISSNPLGALFGSYTMPTFLYDTSLSFESKVFAFNKFLHLLSLGKKPDVFLLGIPEGISEFEVHEYHHFAEYPLVIGSAVPVDSAVFCTYFLETPDIQGIAGIANHSLERFGFPVDMVSIGKSSYETIQGRSVISFSFLDKDYVKKHFAPVDGLPDSVSAVWDTKKTQLAMRNLLQKLQSNVNAI